MHIKKLTQHESFGGILLIVAVIAALIIVNSPLQWIYDTVLNTPLTVKYGDLGLQKSLLLWINDGLMAIFFLLVGLEVKKEIYEGELSTVKKASLPIIAALGGIIVPALIYTYFNIHDEIAIRGWAIPAATDIAFAIGVLALIGKGVPTPLKVLLLSIAIIDDIVAIAIIATFYTEDLSLNNLMLAGAGLLVAIALNRAKVKNLTPYFLIGLFIWFCTVKSGVHATLAGAALAMVIPGKTDKKNDVSPMLKLEHDLYPWVYFWIMPIFAFANSGINLGTFSPKDLTGSVAVGVLAGLVIGKQVGVFSFIWLGEKLGISHKPRNSCWIDIYGIALLTGIGFTMSLFIGTLAFDSYELNVQVRISVLIASLISAILGYIVLKLNTVKRVQAEADLRAKEKEKEEKKTVKKKKTTTKKTTKKGK